MTTVARRADLSPDGGTSAVIQEACHGFVGHFLMISGRFADRAGGMFLMTRRVEWTEVDRNYCGREQGGRAMAARTFMGIMLACAVGVASAAGAAAHRVTGLVT